MRNDSDPRGTTMTHLLDALGLEGRIGGPLWPGRTAPMLVGDVMRGYPWAGATRGDVMDSLQAAVHCYPPFVSQMADGEGRVRYRITVAGRIELHRRYAAAPARRMKEEERR